VPEKYRKRAIDAEQQADRARNETERKAFVEIAALWRRLENNQSMSNDASRRSD